MPLRRSIPALILACAAGGCASAPATGKAAAAPVPKDVLSKQDAVVARAIDLTGAMGNYPQIEDLDGSNPKPGWHEVAAGRFDLFSK